jgi:eukaryotic-like serine/threonine-protein kinase
MFMEIERVKALFAEASQLGSAGERTAYLDAACAGDSGLREQVQSLLDAQEKLGNFLESNQPPDMAGACIGPYRLLEQIGEGGFGVVYMAEQEKPVRRKVALKLIKAGMDTKEVIARFEAERQALALMDHPSIAKVLDAGTTDQTFPGDHETLDAENPESQIANPKSQIPSGRPYFVMELVRGIPITAFAEEKRLSVKQRLELFMQVCNAIQHAHQKGIIHRDIKPSNVMITMIDARPVPKVIDFGVAKAIEQRLTEKTLFTSYGQMIGTPAYMSPEQAELSGQDVDTRSDIYSLGCLLYELLTGTAPIEREKLRKAGLDEIRRMIRETDPPTPSTRLRERARTVAGAQARSSLLAPHSSLPADLDWIVMKCLEKHRNRRYETANGLAKDLQRHLKKEPIVARPPSAAYRVSRFVQRNLLWVGAAVLISTMLTVATAISTRQMVLAKIERQKAESIAAQAQLEKQRADQATAAAEAALYQSRLSETRALRLARPQGWSSVAYENLRQDSAMAIPQRDLRTMREEAVACMQYLDVREVARLPAHQQGVWSLDFSPDSTTLASAGYDGRLGLWDWAAQKTRTAFFDPRADYQRQSHNSSAPFPAVRFSPTGDLLAYATWSNSVKVVSPKNGYKTVANIDAPETSRQGHAQYLAFDDSGRALVVAWSFGQLVAYDTASFESIRTIDLERNLTMRREAVAVAPGGKTVAAIGPNHRVELHSLESEAPGRILGQHDGPVTSLCFSPDGSLLVSTSEDHTAKIFDLEKQQERMTLAGHRARVQAAAFAPDAALLATASDDGTVRLWHPMTGESLLVIRPEIGPLLSVAFSPDGQKLALAHYEIRVYELVNHETRRVLTGHKYFITSLGFHPAEPWLASASADNSTRLWDVDSGRLVRRFPGHPGGYPNALSFSSDGVMLATGHLKYENRPVHDHVLRVWETATGRLKHSLAGHATIIPSTSFDPFLQLLASGDNGGRIIVWDLGAEVPVHIWEGSAKVSALAFLHSDYSLLAGYSDGQIVVFDLITGEPAIRVSVGERVSDYAVSGDLKQLAVGAAAGTIHLFELPGLAPVRTFEEEADPNLAFNPEGTVLAVAVNRRVNLRNPRTGQIFLQLPPQESRIRKLAFGPRHRLAIGGAEEQVTVWDLAAVSHHLRDLGIEWEDDPLSQSPVKDLVSAAQGTSGEPELGAKPPAADQRLGWLATVATSLLNETNRSPAEGIRMASFASRLANLSQRGEQDIALAEALSLRSLELAPSVPEVWSARAELLVQAGNIEGGLSALSAGIEHASGNPRLWNSKGLLLRSQGRVEEAILSFTHAVENSEANTNAFGGILKEALLNRAKALQNSNRAMEAAQDFCRAHGVKMRASETSPDLIDLTFFYNASVTHGWLPPLTQDRIEQNNLARLPQGVQQFEAVSFDVRGLIQLSGNALKARSKAFPEQVSGIPVGRTARRLHVLHATAWSAPEGAVIAHYSIHYSDGDIQIIPVRFAFDLDNWQPPFIKKSSRSQASIVWTEPNTLGASGAMRYLYMRTWDLERHTLVERIDLESAMTDAAPFVVAITVEP